MRFKDYLTELNKIKLLTQEEERSLWQAFSAGDEKARRQLIQSYQPLVFKQVVSFKKMSNIMDIIQEGTVGLIEAVESYDYKKGVAFSLFAVHRIRGRIYTYLRKEEKAGVACIDADIEDGYSQKDLLIDEVPSISEQVEMKALTKIVLDALERLPRKERLVIEQVYLESEEVKSVAENMNVSASHIYRLQKTGIRRIRGMLSRFMKNW